MQLADERLVKDVFARLVRPGFTVPDVELLPFVQLALSGDVAWDQAGEFVCIKRSGAPADSLV